MTVRRYAALAAVLTGGACASLPFYRDRAGLPPPANVAIDHEPTRHTVSTPLEAPRIAVESGNLNPIITRSPLPDDSAAVLALPDWHQAASIPPVADDAPLPLLPHFPIAPRTVAQNVSGAKIHEPDFSQSEPARIPTAAAVAPVAMPPKLHRIVDGDSLSRLALRYLGDERRSSEIAALNRGVILDPHLLPVGKEIAIPRSNVP